MAEGSIIFVHGTGVRLKTYQSGFEKARTVAQANGIGQEMVECAWGDALGVTFDGLSVPGPPSEKQQKEEAEDFARWSWLFDDPLFELAQLTIRDTSDVEKEPANPRLKPAWQTLWEQIKGYTPSTEFRLLLERAALDDLWTGAWSAILEESTIPEEAFEASAHELPDTCTALARALVAELHVLAVQAGRPGPSRALRNSLVDQLRADWHQQVYGLGTFLADLFKRALTPLVRHYRAGISAGIALPVGDVVLYQSRGEEIRQFIRGKVAAAKPPVTIVAHSLGGIACVDLLALANAPRVAKLVTAGSQAPLLFELGALFSMKPTPGHAPPYPLPNGFPPWLNFYDTNDFLSYIGGKLFTGVADEEFHSGQPFPDSHSAYFGDPEFWKKTAAFIAK